MADLDKVFKAYDIRGKYPQDIDEDLAWKVGHAAGQFLRSMLTGYERGQASSNRMVVGQDMRPHSKDLVKALIEGITSTGTACVDIGLCDTPMVSFAINHLGSCGGIQVTASHNPVEDNGFKISGFKAKPVGQNSGLNEIKRIAASLRRMPLGASVAPVHQVNLWEDYRKHVLAFLKLARPLRVVVDASNGVAGKMVPEIFRGTDLDIIPLNFQIGQGFAHSLNPLEEATLSQLEAALREQPADFGVCFDGDADRCVFVEETGRTISADLVTALIARSLLTPSERAVIVYDLRSSHVVPEEISRAGGIPCQERVGHAFMKATMRKRNALFGGELAGHYYYRDNYFADSAMITFALMLNILSAQPEKPLSEIIAPLRRYSSTGEINFEVADPDAKIREIARRFAKGRIHYLDGITVEFDDWWFNCRKSNTEPLLRLNLEANSPQMMEKARQEVEAVIRS